MPPCTSSCTPPHCCNADTRMRPPTRACDRTSIRAMLAAADQSLEELLASDTGSTRETESNPGSAAGRCSTSENEDGGHLDPDYSDGSNSTSSSDGAKAQGEGGGGGNGGGASGKSRGHRAVRSGRVRTAELQTDFRLDAGRTRNELAAVDAQHQVRACVRVLVCACVRERESEREREREKERRKRERERACMCGGCNHVVIPTPHRVCGCAGPDGADAAAAGGRKASEHATAAEDGGAGCTLQAPGCRAEAGLGC